MKYRIWVLIIIASKLSFLNNLEAQWKQADGPYGGTILSSAIYDNKIFVGTNGGGIFSSSDGGKNWVSKNVGLTDFTINTLHVYENNIYAGSNNNFYISTNEGVNWESLSTSSIGPNLCSSILCFDSTIIVGSYGGGLFYSSDRGTNWNHIKNDFRMQYGGEYAVTSLIKLDSIIFAGTYGGGIYILTNDGFNWVKSSLTSGIVHSLYNWENNIYVGTEDQGVYYSSDNGTTWLQINSGLEDIAVWSLTVSQNKLFVGTSTGLYSFANENSIWSKTNLNNAWVYSLFDYKDLLFAGIWRCGIQFSSDSGSSWIVSENGLINTTINSFSNNGNYIYSAAYEGVFHSVDGVTNWDLLNSGLPNQPIRSIVATDNYLFAGTIDLTNAGIFRSSNKGGAWESVNNGIRSTSIYSLFATDSKVYAGTFNQGVYISDNNGLNWTQSNVTNGSIYSFTLCDSIIFAGGTAVYRSSDKGMNWENMGFNSNYYINSIAIIDSTIFACNSEGIYFSNINGNEWQKKNLWSEFASVNTIIKVGTSILIGTGTGINLSSDGGIKWDEINTGLPTSKNINALTVYDSNILAAVDGLGIWYCPISKLPDLVSVQKLENELPNQFVLEQNYPNPFNANTIIKFSIPSTSNVTLKIYNMLGEEVALLVNEVMSKGSYLREWNASKNSSGVYYYQIVAKDFVSTKKLLLLK
ncbi:MAG: T9SS type A sorting domain-containing protein [Melioribacteraceae bacterium]|nr:T9SS type A sorting domain-containing protein [Melioribacteraceae bacterium]